VFNVTKLDLDCVQSTVSQKKYEFDIDIEFANTVYGYVTNRF
jgi:hypothetical protein